MQMRNLLTFNHADCTTYCNIVHKTKWSIFCIGGVFFGGPISYSQGMMHIAL